MNTDTNSNKTPRGRTPLEFRTLALLIFGTAGIVGLVGVLSLAHFRPDATATAIQMVTTVLGLISGFTVLAYGLNKLNETVKEVRSNTNGTLSELRRELAAKDATIIRQAGEIGSLRTTKGINE